MKRCCRCKEEKLLSAFQRDRSRLDGLRPDCRSCVNLSRRQRAQTPEAKARRKAYDRSAHGAAAKRAARERYAQSQNGRAVKRVGDKRYAATEAGRASHRGANERYRQTENRQISKRRWAHSAAGRAWHRQDRARRRLLHQVGADADSVAYVEVLRCDPCSYCGLPCEHVDHIESVASGGSGAFDNLTAACGSCNRRKQDKPLLEFLLVPIGLS